MQRLFGKLLNKSGVQGLPCKASLALLNRFRTILFVILLLCSVLPLSYVQAQDRCVTALEEAAHAYDLNNYKTAIALLELCKPENFRERAHKLRGFYLLIESYIAERDNREARINIDKLLQVDENFPEDPQQHSSKFTDLLRRGKERMAAQKQGRNYTGWILGGIGAGAVALYIILSGDEKQTTQEERVTLPVAPVDPPNR